LGNAYLSENLAIRHERAEPLEIDNQAILAAFRRLESDPGTEKTHLFHGRYENIYPPRERFPEIEPLLRLVEEKCRDILELGDEQIGIAFWINAMRPGDITTLHTHNDADELLSGVYYLEVPENSGDIVFHSGDARHAFTPRSGDLFLFPPDLPHEVERNNSSSTRLSVAFNVGTRREADA
jgi:hypothetical protein